MLPAVQVVRVDHVVRVRGGASCLSFQRAGTLVNVFMRWPPSFALRAHWVDLAAAARHDAGDEPRARNGRSDARRPPPPASATGENVTRLHSEGVAMFASPHRLSLRYAAAARRCSPVRFREAAACWVWPASSKHSAARTSLSAGRPSVVAAAAGRSKRRICTIRPGKSSTQ